VVALGDSDVTIKIGDEGGGMKKGETKKCWTYLHSTAPPPPEMEGASNGDGSEDDEEDDDKEIRSETGTYGMALGSISRNSATSNSGLSSSGDDSNSDGGDDGDGGSKAGALAGYGFGLPLSRLYCRYFGGDLSIVSMEGFGTDA
jgi:pyruvate dehydrogenase kinase 2/3/4